MRASPRLQEHASFPCLVEPLFDVPPIGRDLAPIFGCRRIDALIMQALGELTVGEPFAERPLVSNGLQFLAWEPMRGWCLGARRLLGLRHGNRWRCLGC